MTPTPSLAQPVSEIVTRKSPSFIPATVEGSAGLPRHDGSAVACHLA
jgi:hypothetical protein